MSVPLRPFLCFFFFFILCSALLLTYSQSLWVFSLLGRKWTTRRRPLRLPRLSSAPSAWTTSPMTVAVLSSGFAALTRFISVSKSHRLRQLLNIFLLFSVISLLNDICVYIFFSKLLLMIITGFHRNDCHCYYCC